MFASAKTAAVRFVGYDPLILNRIPADVQTLFFDLLVAAGVNGIFLALSALVLWAMDRAALAGRLAGGLAVFSLIIAVVVWLSAIVQSRFRIEDDPPSNAFVIMNVAISGILQVGWSAYAAHAAGSFAAGAPLGITLTVHLIGILASFLASVMVGAFYTGHLYKVVNAVLAVAGYVVFALVGGH